MLFPTVTYPTIYKLPPTSLLHFVNRHLSPFFSKMDAILKPPDVVRGITELDKNLFKKDIQVTCLTLKDVKISQILPVVKPYLLKLDNFKPIQHSEDNVEVFLNPIKVGAWSSLPQEAQKALNDISVNETHFKERNLTLGFENYSVESIFRAVLPVETEGMSSFTKVGHIVHVNLREHLLPYKKLIGEVLFGKISGCRSVVNKVNMINNTYRNFQMEVLQGDEDMLTTVKENGCTFRFDFSKVYWNSRLCTEHERIVKIVKADDVLFDVFAGVGPFALPSAKKKCYVYANDLNPESYKWLVHNAKANKVNEEYFKSFNKDGGDFIKEDVKITLPECLKSDRNVYIVMNLPALAVDFLKCFVGLFKDDELPEVFKPPTVFVYCFSKGVDYVTIAKDLVNDSFGFDVTEKIMDVFRVRTVSSLKEMMRVAIRLDRDILVGSICRKRKLEDSLGSSKKLNTTMGKNKKKMNSVFKVAGAKSLKLKAKAKAVKSDLKNIKSKTKTKTLEIDKALVHLEDKIRQTSSAQEKPKPPKSKLPTVDKEKTLKTQKNAEEAMADLNKMQL